MCIYDTLVGPVGCTCVLQLPKLGCNYCHIGIFYHVSLSIFKYWPCLVIYILINILNDYAYKLVKTSYTIKKGKHSLHVESCLTILFSLVLFVYVVLATLIFCLNYACRCVWGWVCVWKDVSLQSVCGVTNLCLTSTVVVASHKSIAFPMSAPFALRWSCR